MTREGFVWNRKALLAIRRLKETKDTLKGVAEGTARSSGEGYEVSVGEGKTRSRASVYTATAAAMRAESKDGNLMRALANRRV